MPRHQRGRLYEASGSFYIQFYVTEFVGGKERRVRRSHRLAYKDDKHYSVNAKVVKLLRDEFMLTVNSRVDGHANPSDVKITEFWEKTYLPYARENLRHSTVSGYGHIWEPRLRNHFAGRTLREYRTHHGSEFLTSLTKKLGRRTIAHIRSLASGIFTHAVNTGLIESNPWHDVKVLGKVRAPGVTPHYTLEEIENIISALIDRVDGQLVMALSFFAGLRPSEIAGLRWEDFSNEQVHIRRASVRGKVDECKTAESMASLPLLPQVLVPLELWRQKSGKPTEGWVFPNRFNKPMDPREFARQAIRPAMEKNKLEWKGLYAGRRGAGTILVDLTGNLVAAQELLRHKSLTTTAMHYKKRTQHALPEGLRLLGEAANKN